jgi:hypothetical protein
MKALVLTLNQWAKIYCEIKANYPPSVTLSREKMRRVLGFTPREHQEWRGPEEPIFGYKTTVHLDFFDEQQRTMFLLKYGDWIREEVENS